CKHAQPFLWVSARLVHTSEFLLGEMGEGTTSFLITDRSSFKLRLASNAAVRSLGSPGIVEPERAFRTMRFRQVRARSPHGFDDRLGSKCERLATSTCGPVLLRDPTSRQTC